MFATLDPTVRKLQGLRSGNAVLADTVGFVRDLPHDLVAAFRSTLSEARDADLLLHVIDAADPRRDERIEEVQIVLAEIGADDIEQVHVWNKIDLVPGAAPRLDQIAGGTLPRVWLSARDGRGLDLLRETIDAQFARLRVHATAQLPAEAGRLRAKLYGLGAVSAEQANDSGWMITVDAPRAAIQALASIDGVEGEWVRRHVLAS